MSRLIQIEATPDLVEPVWHALLDAICHGSLAPGSRTLADGVAAQLAASRPPGGGSETLATRA